MMRIIPEIEPFAFSKIVKRKCVEDKTDNKDQSGTAKYL